MKRLNKQCLEVRTGISSLRDPGPVERSHFDLHLRRCESCRDAVLGLEAIESFKAVVPELTQERRDLIFDRLVPATHEFARQYGRSLEHRHTRPAILWAAVIMAAAAAVLTALFVRVPISSDEAGYPQIAANSAAVDDVLAEMAPDNNGYVDRLEGSVDIFGTDDAVNNGRFVVTPQTSIRQDDSARSNFRIGNYARIALLDQSELSVISDSAEMLTLHLARGKLAVDFDGSWGKRLEIHTPDVIVRVKGTVFTVEVMEGLATRVGVLEGAVEVLQIGAMSGNPLEVSDGEMLVLPGEERTTLLEHEQRALAGEVSPVLDSFVAVGGRMVHFSGSPERVKVEVDNRFVGYTPLSVRLSRGPMDYRLSAPGMETVEAQLNREQVDESVQVTMNPARHYRPVVDRDRRRSVRRSGVDSGMDQMAVSLMTRARSALSAGDVDYAARLLNQASSGLNGEELVTALSLLAECYSAAGNFVMAADTFDRVASLVPGTKIAQNSRYEVGRLAMDHIGDYNRARNAFTAYIASPLGGDLKETAYFSLCELYGREGVPRSALQCFNDFLRTFPGSYRLPQAQLWRGVLLQEVEQRWSDAERDLLSFIHAKPRHPRCEEARYRIALGRYHQGNPRGAISMIDEYLQQHPGGQYQVRVERLRREILNPASSKKASVR